MKDYTLIISEKPDAAERIAKALGKTEKVLLGESNIFEVKEKNVVVAPAVGHLFGLQRKGRGGEYPIFDIEWVPTYTSKKAFFSKKYYDTMVMAAKNAKDFIVATDWDTEGDVIAYNILRFICNKKNAKRMKFSTLVKEELEDSYKNVLKRMDIGQVNSGLTRHYLDWYYGVNISRALMFALKNFGKSFSILSTGRVQGPTLKLLSKKEKEIKAFVPEPFWEVFLYVLINGKDFTAEFSKKQIWKKQEAEDVLKACKGKDAKVLEIKKSQIKKEPPMPFDMTALQTEAYSHFGYSPRQTSDYAQRLYVQALISYPRTSSQKLPEKIGYKNILTSLLKIKEYSKFCKELLEKKELKPVEGKKIDPAHPAIYPTGELPTKKLKPQEKKVYDMIVKRFFSVFGEPAVRESTRVKLGIGKHEFKITGSKTIKPGWTKFYSPYSKLQEIEFPDIKEGQILKNKKTDLVSKETSPPPRYSQGSIIKTLEEKNLGTKATRAGILQTLYDRNYVLGKSIQVTDLGMAVIEALDKYCPEILSEKLTRKFEEEMDFIYKGKYDKEKTLEEARGLLTKILKKFKAKEKEIGKGLNKAVSITRKKASEVGPCPNCGKMLKLMFSRAKRSRFIGCSGYPDCKTGFPMPQKGKVTTTENLCKHCNHPILRVQFMGKRPWNLCINPLCPGKPEELRKKAKEFMDKKKKEFEKKKQEEAKLEKKETAEKTETKKEKIKEPKEKKAKIKKK